MYTFSIITSNLVQTITPFIKLLNQIIPENILQARLCEMIHQKYECIVVYSGSNLIGIAGIWIRTNYYFGKHIEPESVIILPEYRNKVIGDLLIRWIYSYGQKQGCVGSELNCYTSNTKGIKFWLNQHCKIIGFRLQKIFNRV